MMMKRIGAIAQAIVMTIGAAGLASAQSALPEASLRAKDAKYALEDAFAVMSPESVIAAADAGDPVAATFAGLMHSIGMTVDRSYERAFAYYQTGCAGGVDRACVNLGLHYDGGYVVETDHERAGCYFERTCSRGSPRGCKFLADLYRSGEGTEQNVKAAVAFYDRSCELGLEKGCAFAAQMRQWSQYERSLDTVEAQPFCADPVLSVLEMAPLGETG